MGTIAFQVYGTCIIHLNYSSISVTKKEESACIAVAVLLAKLFVGTRSCRGYVNDNVAPLSAYLLSGYFFLERYR